AERRSSNDGRASRPAESDVTGRERGTRPTAPCRIGAVIGSRPKVEEEALESFGLNLGIAFQLIDDVLDYSAKQAELGKSIGDDFRDGKITLPVILAFRRGDETERAFWRRCLEDLQQRDEDLERAIALLERHGALRDTIARAAHSGPTPPDALGIFPDSRERRPFLEATVSSIARAH